MKTISAAIAGLLVGAAFVPPVSAQSFDESALLARLSALRASNNDPATDGRWVQAKNHSEKCALYTWGGDDPIRTFKWFGECRDGKASGIGVVVANSPQGGLTVSLDEYGLLGVVGSVTYRQVNVAPQQKLIMKGRVSPGQRVLSVMSVTSSPKGNPTVTVVQESCRDGECYRRMVDPHTGSMFYQLNGLSGYSVGWIDQRADNQALFNRRFLSMDGATPIEKYVFDGSVYDFYKDLRSGQSNRVKFSDGINAALALPLEGFSSVDQEITAAVAASDSKFAGVYAHFCGAQKNQDIRILCDPSDLIPKDEDLVAARAENNESGRSYYQQLQSSAAAGTAQAAQAAQIQAQQQQMQMQQQALAAEQQRQATQEALRSGFEAINQAGQAAQRAGQQLQQSYGAPQVQTPALHQTGIAQCRTIGYITTCN